MFSAREQSYLALSNNSKIALSCFQGEISMIKFILTKKILRVLTPLGIILLASCGNNSSSGGSGTNIPQPAQVASDITIDSAGVVPVFNNGSTTSIIYIHNNSKSAINGIAYSARVNVDDSSLVKSIINQAKKMLGMKIGAASTKFLDPISVAKCSAIPAQQSCPLIFTTPVLDGVEEQGSALIRADYATDKDVKSYSQVISYANVNDNEEKGAQFKSGVNISSTGNDLGYGTVYLYGSGTNKIYEVENISSDKPGIKIVQGDISGRQIQSNYVQAVEVRAPAPKEKNAGIFATLTANSKELDSVRQFQSSVQASVNPVGNGAVLTSGLVPIIRTDTANPNGEMYIINAGNGTATLGTITYPAGITPSTGVGACGATLAPGAGCTIYFNVTQASGSGAISVPYTGGVGSPLAQTVVWYNPTGGALVQMSASPDPVSFSATVGGSTVVTIVNVGGYDLNNVSVANPTALTGSGTGVAGALTCSAGGTNLPIGGNCTFNVGVNDNITENGYLKISISGNYNDGAAKTYTRMLALGYISNAYAANLSVAPTTPMTITGNNTDNQSQVLVVSNNGQAGATITGSTFTVGGAYFTITNDQCNGNPLPAGNSCNVTVRLGPVTAQSNIVGTATYQVTYNGGGQTPPGSTATGNIDYTILANVQDLALTSQSVSNSATGDGSSATPYILNGNATSTKAVTLTYTNQGTNPIVIRGITNTNSPISWLLDTASTTCLTSGGTAPSATLNPGNTCIVVFKNVLDQYALAVTGGLGASYVQNITVPTLVFADTVAVGTQFIVQPTLPAPLSGTILYVTGNQATVANNTVQSGSNVTVSHTLANGASYAAIQMTANMEDYFSAAGSLNNCTSSAANGIRTQNCTLTPDGSGVANASVTYTVNSLYVNSVLSVLYSINPNNQTVSMNPLSQQITIAP